MYQKQTVNLISETNKHWDSNKWKVKNEENKVQNYFSKNIQLVDDKIRTRTTQVFCPKIVLFLHSV